MCEVSNFADGKRAEDMDLDIFREIVGTNKHILEFSITGLAEPTLLNDLGHYLKSLNDSMAWVHMVTNATLLHNEHILESLVENCPDEIQVSIDSADPVKYENIRRGSKFNRVKDNAEKLNSALRQEGRHNITKLCSVYQEEGVEPLIRLLELAAETGFSCLAVTIDMHDWGSKLWSKNLENRNDKVLGSAQYLVDYAKSLQVRLQLITTTRKYSTSSDPEMASLSESGRCPWPFVRGFISSDMKLVPCCHISSPDIFSLGDFGEDGSYSLESINQLPSMLEFRKMHIEGRLPEVCRACYRSNGQ
jgi:pyrroloquinoline quinone biosynthesis protein E